MRKKDEETLLGLLFFIGLIVYVLYLYWWIFLIILLIIIIVAIIMHRKNKKFTSLDEELEKIDMMAGRDFEDYIVELLKYDGYKNVERTKYSGDFGVDIVASKNGIKCAIQCKRFNEKVNLKAVQEIVSGRKHYKCEKAIVVTNNYYANSAKELAFSNKVELLDRDYIISILKKKLNSINKHQKEVENVD